MDLVALSILFNPFDYENITSVIFLKPIPCSRDIISLTRSVGCRATWSTVMSPLRYACIVPFSRYMITYPEMNFSCHCICISQAWSRIMNIFASVSLRCTDATASPIEIVNLGVKFHKEPSNCDERVRTALLKIGRTTAFRYLKFSSKIPVLILI